MMEHNTDRLFWTLTSIIVGALLLTISVKAFPSVASTITAPLQGVIKQGDSTTKTADQAFKDATNNNRNSSSNSNNSQPTDPDTQAKVNAVEASTLNLKVIPNKDGTGILAGTIKGTWNGALNIPEYIKVNGQLTKITSIRANAFLYNNLITSINIPNSVTSIGDGAFAYNSLTSVNIPNSVTNIGDATFYFNHLTSVNIPNSVTNIRKNTFNSNNLTSVNIPNSVTNIGDGAFGYNNLTSVNIPNSVTNIGANTFSYNNLTSINIPNQQAYQSATSNSAFDSNVNVTNNPSN